MKYTDDKDKIIYNGDTTVVYGTGILANPLVQKLNKDFGSLYFESDGLVFSEPVYVQGVTHRDASDSYDRTMGVKVASRKAELKARIKMRRRMMKILNKMKELQELLEDEERQEFRRILALQEELKEIRKK